MKKAWLFTIIFSLLVNNTWAEDDKGSSIPVTPTNGALVLITGLFGITRDYQIMKQKERINDSQRAHAKSELEAKYSSYGHSDPVQGELGDQSIDNSGNICK